MVESGRTELTNQALAGVTSSETKLTPAHITTCIVS